MSEKKQAILLVLAIVLVFFLSYLLITSEPEYKCPNCGHRFNYRESRP